MRAGWIERVGAAALCAAITLGGARAEAQTGEDKAAAEALFDEGLKLLEAKRFGEACPKLEASHKLDPGIGTLLYLADCYEGMARFASAWATFRDGAAQAKAAGQVERERVARARAARLEGKLFRLTIQVAAADTAGLEVRRGEASVRREVWGAALPVDPGEHTITVSAPGKKTWSTTVKIPAGAGAQTVAVPALEDAPGEKPAPAPPPPGPRVDPAPATPPPSASAPPGLGPQRLAGIVVGVVGVGALGVGGLLGGLAAASNTTAKRACPQVLCADVSGVDASRRAATFADASTGLLIGGGVVAAAGLVVALTASRSAPRERAWIAPAVGAGFAGLSAGRTW